MFTGVFNFNFTLPKPLLLSTEEIWYAAPVALLMFASLVYSISSNIVFYRRRRSHDEQISFKSASHVLFHKDKDETMLEADAKYAKQLQLEENKDKDETMLQADAKYAEELQLQEALVASRSSTHRASLGSLLKRVVCLICLENKESWQMFTNSTCSHSFCKDCTTKHATTKIQAKNKTIACPDINCNSTLDFNALRLIIPKQTLVKWDDFLCESIIPESHKLYCPFINCSVLLINDATRNGVTKIDCPVCRRSFCTVCRVPWHSELSCKEFGKLKAKTSDELAVALAKKKRWKKCPSCNFFVEKAEGCVHITCRCEYEFCYACGGKWSHAHYQCRSKR